MQKRNIISAILVVLILLLGVLFWAFQRGVLRFENGGVSFSKEAISNPEPSLDRPITFPADYSEAAKDLYNSNLSKLRERINANPDDFEAWLDLAIYYRMVNDNAGAVEVWEYVRKKYPEDGISRHNLASYYLFQEKDYEKAEDLYRESIKVAPNLDTNYTDLYEMYRNSYKQETNAALDILLEAVNTTKEPVSIQFKIMLGRHYRDVLKDKENARKYLTEARDAAQARGDRSVANEINAEILAL